MTNRVNLLTMYRTIRFRNSLIATRNMFSIKNFLVDFRVSFGYKVFFVEMYRGDSKHCFQCDLSHRRKKSIKKTKNN